jgi:S1-C subfamily serine protease
MRMLLQVSLVTTLFAGLSSSAQTSEDRLNCAQLMAQSTEALNNHQWRALVDVSREWWANCTFEPADLRAIDLADIGIGMIELRQYEDAVPVLRRCAVIDPDYAGCWEELGEAYFNLGQLKEAEQSFRSAIQVGATDKVNAAAIDAAKQALAYIEPLKKQTAASISPETPTHTYGTGFFVTADGYLLTNNHVVAGCSSVAMRNGTPLELVGRSPSVDLALLKANAAPTTFATFRSGPSPRRGDSVVAFGFPLVDILSSEGNVSAGIVSATAGLQDDVRYIQVSSPLQPGNSGGPLLDTSGHVIGVIVAKLDAVKITQITGDIPQNVNFAVHWAEVRAFLDEQGIQYRKSPSERAMTTANIAAVATRMSVAIDCAEQRSPLRELISSQMPAARGSSLHRVLGKTSGAK